MDLAGIAAVSCSPRLQILDDVHVFITEYRENPVTVVQDIFGVHLIHGPLKIPHDTIMLGSMFRCELSGYWTKLTPFETILANPVHGQIYTLSSDNRLLAYEYREGLVPKNVVDIDHAFFRELFKFLRLNKLAGLLALELLEDTSSL